MAVTTKQKSRASSARSSYLELLAQIVISLLVLATVALLLHYVGIVFAPVLVSLLLAYVLNNMIAWVERKGVHRTLAVLVIASVALFTLAAFALLFVPSLVQEFGVAFQNLPERINQAVTEGRLRLARQLGIKPEQLEGAVANLTAQLETLGEAAANALLNAAASIFNLALIPIFTIYFMRHWNRIVRLPLHLVPERLRPGVIERARVMDSTVGGWVRGQIQVALALAILMAVGLSAVGLRLGFAIGILTGLLNFIPYLGAAVGLFLAILMTLVDGGGLLQLVLVVSVFGAVQMTEGYVLTPWLVGGQVGLNTVAVLIVLLVGGSLFGFLGILLAIPATGVAAVIAYDALEIYRHSSFWRGTAHDGPIARQLMRPPTYAPLGQMLSLEHDPVLAPTPQGTAPPDPTAGVAPTREPLPALPPPGAEPVSEIGPPSGSPTAPPGSAPPTEPDEDP
jgi:predicted PurR-regulated permease PerM